MRRVVFALLVYGLVPVGLVVLYREGWLAVPSGLEGPATTAAVALVLLGFAANVAGWRASLALFGFPVDGAEATAALGLSVMGKYLPGKVWALVGRASYSALRHDWPVVRLSGVSVYAQFVTLWLGLVLGTAGVVALGGSAAWLPVAGAVAAALSLVLFTAPGRRWSMRLMSRFTGQRAPSGEVAPGPLSAVVGWYLLAWLAWAGGFVALANAFPGVAVSPAAGLGFVLAGVIGIVTVFAPGGIGTREAALTGFLVLDGLGLPEATAVAVASRVWFLAGELGLLAAGVVSDHLLRRPPVSPPPG